MAIAAISSPRVIPSVHSIAHRYPSLPFESKDLASRRLHGSLLYLPKARTFSLSLRVGGSDLKGHGQHLVWNRSNKSQRQRCTIISANSASSRITVVRSSEILSAIVSVISKFVVAAALVSEAMSRIAIEKLQSVVLKPLKQEEVKRLAELKLGLGQATLPLCFAAISQSPRVSTPLTVVASGMAKWLELYSGVLMIRVLLSWFPNIPWDRQPLQAIRDMCDPYLNLFRNLIPPVFNALDVSPMLAFFVLGLLASILNANV